MDILKFKSVFELLDVLHDQESCIRFLEEILWDNNPVSPFDPTSKVYVCKNHRYKCRNTGKIFTVTTGTMFHNTKVPLRVWIYAIYMITAHKKGISSLQLARDMNITQKTAWKILQKIRVNFDIPDEEKLEDVVEVDETYVGGKNKNRHKNKRVAQSQGRSTKDKTPVFGAIQRKGKLKVKVVPNTKAKTLKPLIQEWVKKDSTIYSDEWKAYKSLGKNYNHQVVEHGSGQYVVGEAYTNTLEGAWSLFKRGILGIYHYVSKKHLQKYADEFCFRYNTRKISESERFTLFLQNAKKPITYQELKCS